MSRKFVPLFSLFLVVMLILAACGGGQSAPTPTTAPAEAPAEAPTPTEAAAEAPTAEATGEGEVVHLRFISGGPGAGLDFTMQQVEEWNANHPNIQVEVIAGPTSATDRYGLYLQTFQAQSSDIDVMEIDVIWPGDLAEHLVDLNEYGGAEAVADDFPAIVQNNTVDGRLVGLPFFTDGGLLYYRTDLLEKYGYSGPPTTWAELEEMAQAIQDGERAEGNQDFWGFVWQGKAYEGLTCDALEWIYSSGGGTIVSPDKVITINNQAAAEALDMAYNWIGKITPPGVTGFQEEESRRVWHGGNAAFMRNWPYAYSLSNGEDSAVAGKFDVTALPGKEPGMSAATLGGWQLAVSKYSQHPKEAAEFVMWLASAESQKARAINISLIPTKRSLYEDPEVIAAQPFMAKMLPVFTSAVARPSTVTAPRYNEVSNIFFTNVSDVLTGKQNGTDAVANIELDLQDLLGFEVGAP
ncbi:ABC transporter substrate-binding protein [Litorilinea aerophila]|uniref:ABC transporter substrate-binding protein n=1 Tax=Litorilinea aerophila TaxID=1204385 RepID=A0A540VBQ4_9CHLR|nr:ABC transporter substrate-binding protein [Litorilinea aerophila]MCC9078044.1 ABC transporter substrate-binding protein [Litorilinea aerophila]